MLELLKQKNKDIEIFSVESVEFKKYGRIIRDIDTTEIIKVAKSIEFPKNGNAYVTAHPDFENLAIAKEIENKLFGAMKTQVGYCWGYNTLMNATEWHTSSEIMIAVTPVVLILGNLWDVVDGQIDSSSFKAFYMPQGTVVEVYATSLHYCPCQVSDDGFGCVIGLPEGTNTELTFKSDDKLLVCKNKWLISHKDNKELETANMAVGITGPNIEIIY